MGNSSVVWALSLESYLRMRLFFLRLLLLEVDILYIYLLKENTMANVIIGIDVGLTGGISILIGNKTPVVYRIPVKKIVVNKKNKNTYDMPSIVNILKKYKDDSVIFCIERQSVRPGEGAVSAMTPSMSQITALALLGIVIRFTSFATKSHRFRANVLPCFSFRYRRAISQG